MARQGFADVKGTWGEESMVDRIIGKEWVSRLGIAKLTKQTGQRERIGHHYW